VSALRIATRRSDLAMAQAGIVRLMLTEHGREVVLLPVDTTGDLQGGTNKDRWIDAIVGLLRTGEADLAVHSAKDLPADDPEDLTIAAVPERGDPRDVLVAVDGAYFDGDGPRRGARVGALLSCARPSPGSSWSSCTGTSRPACGSCRKMAVPMWRCSRPPAWTASA
jgi:porphobilinogen deaminase